MLIKLYDEVALMSELYCDTVNLIHATSTIKAIKLLVTAHDIISLNLEIEKNYKPYKNNPPWDIHALKDLNRVRAELLVFYRLDFKPAVLVDTFSVKVENLHRIVNHRLNVLN